MDDELFGFSSNKKSQDQKSKVEFKSNDELDTKSKSAFKDFPSDDPLADISLSDDDFYNISESGNKPVTSSTKIDEITTGAKTSPMKISKAKKIADLFGLDADADQNITKEEKKSESASDWLGIKESHHKSKQDNFLTISEGLDKNKELFPIHENKELKPELDSVNVKKSIVFDVTSGLEESFQTRRRMSKFQNSDKKDNVFDLLEDKGSMKPTVSVELKTNVPRGILDDILNETPVSRGRMRRHNSDEKKSQGESANLWDKPSEQSSEDQYTPSVGTSRRPGYNRKQYDSSLSNPITPPSSLKIIEDSWLTPSALQEKSKQHVIESKEGKGPAKHQSSSVKDITTDKLPSWLGGVVDAPSRKSQHAILQDTGQTFSANTSQVTEVKHEPEKKQAEVTPELLLTASNIQSEQTALALQRTEAQLMAALQLKQQRHNMDAVCQRQTQLLEIQEQQLNSLVEQHLRKQSEVGVKLQVQQERIGLLLQALMTTDTQSLAVNVNQLPILQPHQAEIPVNAAVSEDKSPNETFVAEIEAELKKIRTENQDLRVRIEFLEKTHQNELKALSQVHQHDLEMWFENKERFKTYNKQIQEDCEARINRLQQSATDQLQLEKNWMEKLQTERLNDLNQLGEFYRVQFEQMSALYKALTKDIRPSDMNSIVTIKRPSDETQLTAREAALIHKEVELAAMREKLSLQRENLETRTDELEEKIEQERIKNEEMARQLRREKRELNTKEQLWLKEQGHLKEQHESQMRYIEELRESVVKEQTKLLEDRLHVTEERARLEALSKLHGVNPCATFDILQAQAEVHGALEATRSVEIELGEERQRLRELQRSLELERWKLQEYDRDLATKAEHLDHVLQASEANKEEGLKALDQAKKVQQTAEKRFVEVEQKMKDIIEREQKLVKEKMEFTQEEMRLNKRTEQLDQILPELSAMESLSLQPVSKSVIDPKILIMKLKAEKELEGFGR